MEWPHQAEHGRGGMGGGKMERVPVALAATPSVVTVAAG